MALSPAAPRPFRVRQVTRSQSIPTVAEVPLEVLLCGPEEPPAYQRRVRLFFVDGPRGFCQRHGKSYLTRRRRGGGEGGGAAC